MGFALLAKGMLKEGLEEREWRWKTPTPPSRERFFSQPMWDGIADLKDRTILIWGEQGIGDMIVWSYVLPQVNAYAGHCILECQPKLVQLFTRTFPYIDVRPNVIGQTPQQF